MTMRSVAAVTFLVTPQSCTTQVRPYARGHVHLAMFRSGMPKGE